MSRDCIRGTDGDIAFDVSDRPRGHALRKRIERQHQLVEQAARVLRRRESER